MRLSLAEVHVRQSAAGSCVAACVCMVRRRGGEQVAEATILEAWGSAGPFALTLHAEEVRDRNYPMIIDAVSRSSRGLLRDGRWVIITIAPLPHPSRLHAVVLIGMTDDDSFLYLDPAEPLEAQPLAFSEDELVQQWSGELIVCALFP